MVLECECQPVAGVLQVQALYSIIYILYCHSQVSNLSVSDLQMSVSKFRSTTL